MATLKEKLAFSFLDFGARGVSSQVSAGIGGAAHLSTGAMGTDTITGVLFANQYYNTEMSGYSVFATEHSIMTMRGREGELQIVRDLIRLNTGSILSIVSDGYDIYKLANEFCTTLKDEILAAKIRLVVRPDSGNAIEVILKLLDIFSKGYGYTINSKGYKVLNVIRILQGDGLSKPDDFLDILIAIKQNGYSVENILFGQGGGLLQQVNRDTYQFAMKTCSAKVDGEWIDVFKDPITDSGKRSKKGRLTTVKDINGNISTIRVEDLSDEFTDLMIDVWDTGTLLVDHTLEEVRNRANG
jgi:nicotinamide phosphoribosyltransferase